MIASNPSVPKNIFIAGISSDIGRELAMRFYRLGSRVVGTYRNPANIRNIPDGIDLVSCDIENDEDVISVAHHFSEAEKEGWDLMVFSLGSLDPIGPFFKIDFKEWSQSVHNNSIRQLALVKAMYPMRRAEGKGHIAFFAGAGTNSSARNYSAYCASKILLIKMCELLHDESPDINPFIIGPGMVRTKIHQQTIQAGIKAGENLEKVQTFLQSPQSGVNHQEIFDCLCWCMEAGRDVVGGRNISLVGDDWRDQSNILKEKLRSHKDAFRLRRYSNNI